MYLYKVKKYEYKARSSLPSVPTVLFDARGNMLKVAKHAHVCTNIKTIESLIGYACQYNLEIHNVVYVKITPLILYISVCAILYVVYFQVE